MHQPGLTKNISSGGVLFTTGNELDVGGSIEYIITLTGSTDHSVNLRCIGKVVRHQPIPDADSQSFDIAATLERYEFVRSEH